MGLIRFRRHVTTNSICQHLSFFFQCICNCFMESCMPLQRLKTAENIIIVQMSKCCCRPKFVNSKALGLSVSTTYRILRNDLDLLPYKIVLTQKLKQLDHRKHRDFADFALRPTSKWKRFFLRKSSSLTRFNFNLNGSVNK